MDNKISFGTGKKESIVGCPHCRVLKAVPVSDVPAFGRTYLARCQCGQTFNVYFERRQSGRKKTSLRGIFTSSGSTLRFPITIVDLSNLGIGFKRKKHYSLQVGDQINVEFTLDTPFSPSITCHGMVRRMSADHIGVELASIDCNRTDFGFYLFCPEQELTMESL